MTRYEKCLIFGHPVHYRQILPSTIWLRKTQTTSCMGDDAPKVHPGQWKIVSCMYSRIACRIDSASGVSICQSYTLPCRDIWRILCLPLWGLQGRIPPAEGHRRHSPLNETKCVYSYFPLQFSQYLSCPLLLLDPRVWVFGGFIGRCPTYLGSRG